MRPFEYQSYILKIAVVMVRALLSPESPDLFLQRHTDMKQQRLARIEESIFSLFRNRDTSKVLAKEIFNSSSEYANADLVRAFEDLEKRWRLLVRYSKDGNDWISLTPEGAAYAGVTHYDTDERAVLHPPKSSI